MPTDTEADSGRPLTHQCHSPHRPISIRAGRRQRANLGARHRSRRYRGAHCGLGSEMDTRALLCTVHTAHSGCLLEWLGCGQANRQRSKSAAASRPTALCVNSSWRVDEECLLPLLLRLLVASRLADKQRPDIADHWRRHRGRIDSE